MVTILQLGLTAFFGGTESVVKNQSAALDRSRVQYWFINENEERQLAYTDEFLRHGAKIFGLPSRRKHPLAHYVKMWATLKNLRSEVDGVVFNACSYKQLIPLFFAWFLGYKMRIFHSHTSGDYSGRPQSLMTRGIHNLQRMAAKFLSTDLFACSQKAASWMFGEGVSCRIIPNAINAARYTFEKSESSHKGLKIGMVGNFVYPKNHAFALRMFVQLHQMMPASELFLAGTTYNGDDNEYSRAAKKTVADNRVEDVVHFLGRVEDVPALLSRLDCLIMPSFFEGLPMVGLEAQATGLTCFFSDRVTREVQVNENCKFLPIGNGVGEWVEAILRQPDVDRVALSKHFAESKFNIKNSIVDLTMIYELKASR